MSDATLQERLRHLADTPTITGVGPAQTCREAADALDAKDREIERLLTEAEGLNYDRDIMREHMEGYRERYTAAINGVPAVAQRPKALYARTDENV